MAKQSGTAYQHNLDELFADDGSVTVVVYCLLLVHCYHIMAN